MGTPNTICASKILFRCKVKEMRQKLGLSLRDLEELTGVSNGAISFIERGTNPTLLHAMQLSKALNVPINELWEPL